ncbi:hypothetical protein Acr_00g0079950 [Actinidia rufa]|uniref:Uncharacterized protein n=1 Tax=Actinidia rufa TaxID=165716 RepID=A0A7J0DVR6_9ERIC|nr:hypothetical protein Acr_00g0079950 [Actinidia rufa]
MISPECLSPNPLDRGKTSPPFSMEPRQAISIELAQSQSAVSSSPLGEVEYLARSSPTRILSIHGNYPLRDSLHHDTNNYEILFRWQSFQFGAVCGNDSSRSSMHLRSRHLPRPSASSPPNNRAHPMANPGQIPDLEGLHHEIHGMAEQMRIMNENNGRLIQLLAAANPPLPASSVPEIERSRNSNRSGDRSQNISTERVRGRRRAPSPSLRERSSSSESSKTPTRARRGRSPHRGDHIEARNKQTEPPFTQRVLRARISSKFKLLAQLGVYEGKTNPMDHLDSYKSLMSLQGCSDEVMCKAFSATLKGPARSWFRKLSPRTIDSFGDLSRLFVANFMSYRNRQKNASHLFTIHQKETESLKDFVKRFNQAILEVEDPNDKVIIMAMMEGLRPEKKQGIKDLTEILNALTRGVLALHLAAPSLSYRHSTPPLPKYSRKLSTKNSSNGRKIKTDPQKRNRNKYCEFHRDHGHNTEDCFQLKEQIADLIKRGYLRKYIVTRPPPNSPERRYGDNRPTTGDIQTIHGGFGSGGCSTSSRKKHARSAFRLAKEEIYNLSSPYVGDQTPITFSNDDLRGLHLPHDDALVVSAVIANFNVQRILIDNGSSAYILFISAFERMKIGLDKLHPFHTPLIGFGGNTTHPLGWINLPITLGTEPHQTTIWQDFIVVDCPSPYNAILGRPTLGGIKAITLTYHLKLKFPTPTGIGKIKDPRETNNTKPLEEVVPISIHPDYPDHHIMIGTELTDELRFALINFLKKNYDVFAWSQGDVLGIDPEIAMHKLFTNPKSSPVLQKRRKPRMAIKAQAQALADFIVESNHEGTPQPKTVPLENEISKEPTPEKDLAHWILFVDGSSNQHGCGAGLIIQTPSGEQMEYAIRIGFKATNNEAEYEALLAGLRVVVELGAQSLEIFSDSQLVVNQVQGDYLAKDARMMAYLGEVKAASTRIKEFKIHQIPREENKKADALANLASTFEFMSDRCIPMEFLASPSIGVANQILQTEESPTWMDEIIAYLQGGTLPTDKLQARHSESQGLSSRTMQGSSTTISLGYFVRISPSRHHFSSPGHPQANGQVEVTNRTILRNLKARNVALTPSRDWSPMISLECLSPNPLDRGKMSPPFSMEPRQAISIELAQSQSVVSSSPLGEVEYLARSSPTRILSIHGNYPLRDSLHHDTNNYGILSRWQSFQVAFPVSEAQYRGDRAILTVDVLGPLPQAPLQRKFLIVAIDYFTKWIEAQSLTKITEKNTRDFIWKHVVCKFGILKVIISDNARQFDNDKFELFCSNLTISHYFSLPGHPQANGQVKVTNRTILRNLKARLESSKSEWVEELLSILWAYHTTNQIPTGETLYSMVFGTESVIPVEIGMPSFRTSNFNKENNEIELRLNLNLLDEKREKANLCQATYKCHVARYYYQRVKHRSFLPGDLVL